MIVGKLVFHYVFAQSCTPLLVLELVIMFIVYLWHDEKEIEYLTKSMVVWGMFLTGLP